MRFSFPSRVIVCVRAGMCIVCFELNVLFARPSAYKLCLECVKVTVPWPSFAYHSHASSCCVLRVGHHSYSCHHELLLRTS